MRLALHAFATPAERRPLLAPRQPDAEATEALRYVLGPTTEPRDVPRRASVCFAPPTHGGPDTATFALVRHLTTPWRRTIARPGDSHAGRVPIDVDDLAVAMGNVLSGSALGPVVTAGLLCGGAFFAGLSAMEAWHAYLSLGRSEPDWREARESVRVSPHATCEGASFLQHGCLENLRAWERVADRQLASSWARRRLQLACIVGASCMSASILCNPGLIGQYSHPLRHVSRALAWVGTPAMCLFTGGSALEALLYLVGTGLGEGLAAAQRLPEDDAVHRAALLAEQRRRTLIAAHVCLALGGALMATGTASTFAWGAVGLWAMVPGLLGLQVGLVWRHAVRDTGPVSVHSEGLARQGSMSHVAHRAMNAQTRWEAMAAPAPRLPDPCEDAAAWVGRRAAVELALSERDATLLQGARLEASGPRDLEACDVAMFEVYRACVQWRHWLDAAQGALEPRHFDDLVTMVVEDGLFEDFAWHLHGEPEVQPWFELDGHRVRLSAGSLLGHSPSPSEWEAICRAFVNTWRTAGVRNARQRTQALLDLYAERLRPTSGPIEAQEA